MSNANFRTSTLAIRGGEPEVKAAIPHKGYSAEMIGEEEERYVLQALRSKRLDRSEYHPDEESFTARLEAGLEKYLGVKHVYLMPSASVAMKVALMAMGIGPGDEVIVPSAEWHTMPNAIIGVGAVPVVAQVDERWLIDVKDVERLITPRTRAILVAHLNGAPVDMAPLMELAAKHKVAVMEDNAQSPGATYRGKMLGSIGDVGLFSFHTAKPMGTGSGGFLATNRDDIYEFTVAYQDGLVLPSRKKGLNPPVIPTCSARVNELTAAAAYAQFERLPKVIETQRAVRDAILGGIKDCKRFSVVKPFDPEGDIGVQVILKFGNPEEMAKFEEALKAEGVPMCFTSAGDAYQKYMGACAEQWPAFRAMYNTGRKTVFSVRPFISATWPALQGKAALHPALNPWTHPLRKERGGGDVTYKGIEDVMPSLMAMTSTLIIRINPRMEPKHGQAIAAAVCKVDALL